MSTRKTFTVEITLHSACNLPVADLHTFACDPYVQAFINVPAYPRSPDEPPLSWRSPTVRLTRNPSWDCPWVVAGIPSSGFKLSLRLVDEDPGSRDDRLGKAYLDLTQGQIKEGLELTHQHLSISKRKGSFVPYISTYLAGLIPGQRTVLHPEIVVSVKVLSLDNDATPPTRAYTKGPNKYSRHYSPLIGRMFKEKDQDAEDSENVATQSNPQIRVSSFVANKFQLTGPLPSDLRHRFVAYRPFIDWLFKRSGVLGRLLNLGLHKQYRTIYSYDKNTLYGFVQAEGGRGHQSGDQARSMALKFLELVDYRRHNKIFTYVITLDSEWRFCETGEEFAIELLSKHLMHADLAKEIAFSGEFFVRAKSDHADSDDQDPSHYELVIDNDSGTYRPLKERLPIFREWLAKPSNLGGMGDIIVRDCFDEELKGWKEEIKRSKGGGKVKLTRQKSGSSAESVSSNELGGGNSVSSKEVAAAIRQSFQPNSG